MYGTDERHTLIDAAREARLQDEANALAYAARAPEERRAQDARNALAARAERTLQARIRATMRMPA